MPVSHEPAGHQEAEPVQGSEYPITITKPAAAGLATSWTPPEEIRHHFVAPGIVPALLVLMLAFLLGYMPVRNSDFWLHLAAGRHVLEGRDASFSYVQESQWLHYGWLYDVVLYGLFVSLGATALVALKSCLTAVLAGFMLAAGRVGRSLWVPAGTTMLTLMVMAPWFSLRPVFASYVCFAVVLYCLKRYECGAPDWKVTLALAALFALWANLDGWFVLGCLLLGCWWVGQLLYLKTRLGTAQRSQGGVAPAPLLPSTLLLLGCVTACLVNPNHALVFVPKGDHIFSGVAQYLQTDPLLRAEIVAPWREVYFSNRFFLTGPGLAFWLLVFLGLLSFMLSREGMIRRGVIWCLFLIVSFFQAQVIPFFAMVAGVTLARNAGAWLASRQPQRRHVLAKAGLFLTALAVAAGAWIGLFQSSGLGPRRGTAEVDPGLVGLANQLSEWRAQRQLGDGNGFHLAPETANQIAWLCPREKDFLNSRLAVSPAQAAEYVAVRTGLLAGPGAETTNWRDILRTHKINHVVVYSKDELQTEIAFANLLRQNREWPLLYLGGGAAIFGWRDPADADTARLFTALEKNLDHLAYDSHETSPAPVQGSQREPLSFQWWEAFWKERPIRTSEARAAHMVVTAYDALSPIQRADNFKRWSAFLWASLVAEESWPVAIPLFMGTGDARHKLFLTGQDDGPPAALYLAIRAARRAVDQNPDDVRAYLALGEAYYRLHTGTRERVWANLLPDIGRIRTVQAINAYYNALRLDPDLSTAHDRLAHLFISMEYKDLALKHLREYVRCVRRQAQRTDEGRENLEKLLARPERLLRNLAREVEQLTDRFEINASNLKVFDRANLAGRLGLAGKALETLLESDVSAFGTEGMDMELKLLLLTGNAEKVRLWMHEEQEGMLKAYHWNKVQLHASVGNYVLADEELLKLERVRVLNRDDLTLYGAAGFVLGNGILAPARGGLFQRIPAKVFLVTGVLPPRTYRLLPDEDETVIGLWTVAQGLNRQAKLEVLRGLLMVEAGQIAQAAHQFSKALAVFRSVSAVPFAAEPETIAARDIAARFLKVIAAPEP
jgi:tetratricopeptide (TPR) repeat protein